MSIAFSLPSNPLLVLCKLKMIFLFRENTTDWCIRACKVIKPNFNFQGNTTIEMELG